jgi:hypothetical protein
MFREDALEALPIVRATLDALLEWMPSAGREGADLRARANLLKADAPHLLQQDKLGPRMAQCFDIALQGGLTLWQSERVRGVTDSFKPILVGAKMIKHSLIQLVLVTQARIVAQMRFRSRGDVEDMMKMFNVSFSSVAEAVADEMDSMTYRAIISLHAALTFFLIEFARPLPQMMAYKFNQPMTTLTTAYRLYADASRADEIRYGNRIIHPAFAPRQGLALSA